MLANLSAEDTEECPVMVGAAIEVLKNVFEANAGGYSLEPWRTAHMAGQPMVFWRDSMLFRT